MPKDSNKRKLKSLAKKLYAEPSFNTEELKDGWSCKARVKFKGLGAFEAEGVGKSKLAAEEAAAQMLYAKISKAGAIGIVIAVILRNNRADYATSLKEICEVLGFGRPDYDVVTRHRESFNATVTLKKPDGSLLAEGKGRGKSKSDARCAAARELLIQLKLVKKE